MWHLIIIIIISYNEIATCSKVSDDGIIKMKKMRENIDDKVTPKHVM